VISAKADSSGFPQALPSAYICEGKAGVELLQGQSRRYSGGQSPGNAGAPGRLMYKEGWEEE